MADDGESVYGNAASRVESDDMTRDGETDRNRAIARARVLLDRDPVVIDTETTGVGPVAEVCEIAIVGRTGETMVDMLVRPGRPIPSGGHPDTRDYERRRCDCPELRPSGVRRVSRSAVVDR